MKLKGAIVGLGGMGRRHWECYVEDGRVEVVACCDRNLERLKAFQSETGVKRGYTDWREMLEKESPEILSVATNGPSHCEITLGAIERDVKRIFCEKPMASSPHDGRRMLEEAEKNDVLIAINHSRRWSPMHRKLSELIADGIIGELANLFFIVGGGRLGCNGSHIFDLARMLSSKEIIWAQGVIDRRGTPDPRGPEFKDPGAYGMLALEGGIRTFIDMFEDLGVPPYTVITGSV